MGSSVHSLTRSQPHHEICSCPPLCRLPSQKLSLQLMLRPVLKPGIAATMVILDTDTMATVGVDTMDTEDTEDMDGTDARSVMLKLILLSLLLLLLSPHLKLYTHIPMPTDILMLTMPYMLQ